MVSTAGPVSFGFSKKVSNQKVSSKDHEDEVTNETDYVTSLEGKQVLSTKPVEKKKEDYVIPMIETNRWRVLKKNNEKVESEATKKEKDSEKTSEDADNNDINSLAVKELIADAAKQNEIWEDIGKIDKDLAIPILMKNRVPDGFETDDKLDVSLRPDGPAEADYEAIPIEHFGVAMLRGMGWKDGEGIGKNKKVIAPINAVLRPKGLGLGASAAVLNNSRKKNHKSKDKKEEEELELCNGAYCIIVSGKHSDLYGQIEGIDEDNARVVVKLSISGQSATLSQHSILLIDKHEYQKYSKYINKGKVDKYKEKEEKMNNGNREKHESRKNTDSESDGSNSSHKHRKHKKKHKHKQDDEDRHEERKKDSRKRKNEEDYQSDSKKKTSKSTRTSDSKLWVQSQLRVRIVDKNYKKGKYYNAKVEVVDVMDRNNCICKYDGKLLEELPQSSLETVVPKSHPSYVKIVSGTHQGELGEIIDRNKSKETCTVQLLSNRDIAVTLHLDKICEYVGDIDALMDY